VTTVAWIVLPSIREATALVPDLDGLGAEAVELMLAPALAAAAQAFPGTPQYWHSLDPGAAALLVEFGADSPAGLDAAVAKATAQLAGANLVHPLEFTRDEDQIELYWKVRDGLTGIVGQRRPQGTALVIEDVCFPPDRLADGAQDLQDLLSKHGFMPNAGGHAAYGNLHFMLTPKLADQGDRDRYAAFMSDLVTLVIDSYDGSLKAEHGTGLNMAPFVRREWGDKATDMMWRIKQLPDPYGILAPNVILTRDDGINLKSFKSSPPIEDVAVHCIECGFCEAVCPSRNVTTTPRQRIVLRREMARQPEGSPLLARLQDDYEYDGIETCALDGSCAIPCPVQINTGALEKTFRRAESTPRREKTALLIARRWATGEKLARTAVGAADLVQRTLGVRALTGLTAAARLVVSDDLMPSVPGPMPHAQLRKLPRPRGRAPPRCTSQPASTGSSDATRASPGPARRRSPSGTASPPAQAAPAPGNATPNPIRRVTITQVRTCVGGVISPARSSRASRRESRLSVLTLSEPPLGISDGATTWHATPIEASSRYSS
jgi:D-lactate dehydrogenase